MKSIGEFLESSYVKTQSRDHCSPEARLIEVSRYPTGTKLTGIICVHRLERSIGSLYKSIIGAMEELCEDSTLKNLVIMMHQWSTITVTDELEAALQSNLSNPDGFVQEVVRRGAKIYRCTGTSEPDLGALRIILAGRSVVPEVQQEPINKGSKLEQAAVRPVEPSKDKEVEELRRELKEQKRRAQQEADAFKKHAAEMQSKLEDDRHGSGKTSATYNFQHTPANSRVSLVGPPAHLALQRVYPSTDLHPDSQIGSTMHFTAKSTNNGCKTFRRMTSSGSWTIWIRHVTTPSFLSGRSSGPVGSRKPRSFRSRFAKVLT